MACISSLAAGDLDDLRAEGLQPTDEDVIRLHTLARRITDGNEATAATPPRWYALGGLVFFEPTLAAFEWFKRSSRFADGAEVENIMYAFALAHGRESGYLSALTAETDIEKALGEFMANLTCTMEELGKAITYCSFGGGDGVVAEETPLQKEAREKREENNFSAFEATLVEAAAVLHLGYDDIMKQTPSRLHAMLYRAHVNAGLPLTRSAAKAHAEYLATLDAIKKRLNQTANNGGVDGKRE